MGIGIERFIRGHVGRFAVMLVLAALMGAAPPADKQPADKKPASSVNPQEGGLEGDEATPKKKPDEPKPVKESRFDRIVKDLWDPDEKIREFGIREMHDLERRSGIDIDSAQKALTLALKPYPYTKPAPWYVQSVLVGVTQHPPRTEYIPRLLELFPQLESNARNVVLITLGRMQEREGAEAYMKLLRTHIPTGKIEYLFFQPFSDNLLFPEIFFPEIFELAKHPNPKARHDIWTFGDRYFANKLIPREKVAPYADHLITSYREALAQLAAAKKEQAESKTERTIYYEREYCRTLLALMTFFPADKVEPVLREALKDKDPIIKSWSALTLIFMHKEVDPRFLEEAAAAPEARGNLYQNLTANNGVHLFPEKYLNQKAIAEGDLARRLVTPGFLGRMPDEMELAKVVSIDTGLKDGVYDIYVFRFRVNPPHHKADKGWMVGFSGPFPQKAELPFPLGPVSGTRLDIYDGKTPEQHLEILGPMEKLKAIVRQYHELLKAQE